MARSISQYEQEQIDKTKGQQAGYKQQRDSQADNYIDQTNSALDQQYANKQSEVNKRIEAVPQQFRPQYDKNAVNELINKRMYEENAANMGLTNSGMHRVQQTSAALQREKADAGTRLQQQSAVDSLQQEIQSYLNQISLQKQQKESEIRNQAMGDILNNNTSLYNAAISNASSLYNTDVSAESAAAQREMEQRIAQAQLNEQVRQANAQQAYNQQRLQSEQQAAKLSRDNELYIALLSQQYTPSEARTMIYGTDAEKRNLLYQKLKSQGKTDSEASSQATQQIYGNSQGALLKAFRDLQ